MNRDILNIILNDVLYNDINSIKKTSLICKNIHNNIQILAMKDKIKSKLSILQKYINPDACMEHSASRGYMDIVQLMIEKGAQLCMDWNLAMRNAARGGHINIVQLIIEKGGQRSIDWNGIMERAVGGGHHYVANIVQLLIEKSGERFNWAIVQAEFYGHHYVVDIVELLKQNQANKKI